MAVGVALAVGLGACGAPDRATAHRSNAAAAQSASSSSASTPATNSSAAATRAEFHGQEYRGRVLILGDSISIGYTPIVRELLVDIADVVRPTRLRKGTERPENCEGTDKGVQEIDRWLAASGNPDVIHFNFGLHDIKHVDPKTGRNSNDPADPRQSGPDEYRRQLTAIADRLLETGAALVFATTTPYPAGTKPFRDPTDVVRYNAIATEIMVERQIAIDDLHAYAIGSDAVIQRPRNVHFTPAGSRALAERVADHCRRALRRR